MLRKGCIANNRRNSIKQNRGCCESIRICGLQLWVFLLMSNVLPFSMYGKLLWKLCINLFKCMFGKL